MDKLLETAEAFAIEIETQKAAKAVLKTAAEVQARGMQTSGGEAQGASGKALGKGGDAAKRRRVSLKEREPWG